MKISGNNHNHALVHNSRSVPAELLKQRERSSEAAAGFSNSALTSTRTRRPLESLAYVKLAPISYAETHSAPYSEASCDPVGQNRTGQYHLLFFP